MSLLALCALTDPDTPGHVLATIAAARTGEHDPLLLAHPNTPAQVVTDLHGVLLTDDIAAAMWSPALSDDTRSRLATHLHDNAAARCSRRGQPLGLGPDPAPEHRAARPWLYPELARRALTQGNVPLESMLEAATHPCVDEVTQVELLHAILSHRDLERSAHLLGLLSFAIVSHPGALNALHRAAAALRSARDDHSVSAALVGTLDPVSRARDPRGAYINHVRACVTRGTLYAASAVAVAPDAAFVTRLARRTTPVMGSGEEVYRCAGAMPALYGTQPWVSSVFLSRNLTLRGRRRWIASKNPDAAVTQAQVFDHVLLDLTNQPLHTAPDVMSTLAGARTAPAAHKSTADTIHTLSAVRLALHPNTPDRRMPDLRRRLADTDRSHPPSLTALARAICDTGPTRVAHTLQAAVLNGAAAYDIVIARTLAYHVRDLARQLWVASPNVTRVALGLESTFTGTYSDLLDTARTIAT